MADRDVLSDRDERPASESTWRRFNGYSPAIALEADRLQAENERLRKAFADLIEEAKDMRYYVPDYFAKRWKHDEAIQIAELELARPSDEAGVAGVPATAEITGRSWDAAAAGRRAVEKHADALTRLSDDQAAPACERCGGAVVDPSRHGEGFCVALPRNEAPNGTT